MPDMGTHPSAQALAHFGHGQLSEAQAATVAAHLETCADCRNAVASLSADSFLGQVRAAKSGSSSLPPSPSGSTARAGASPSGVGKAKASATPPANLPPELANHPKFRILRELGKGGMGVIYLAEHRVMEKPVALKVISPAVLDNPSALARFHAEARAAGQLDHPNIARAYDADQAGDLHFLVLEFIEGMSLAQLVHKKGPLPIAHACHYARQAALGLQHASEKGMVHRDVKPQNLMLAPKGVVKVLDFGLARLQSERKGAVGLTQADSFMGTPEYVAPEQATDARTADTRADIYSLGCTLYALLTGRPPFVEDTPVKLVLAHLEKEPRPLHEVRSDVPTGLSMVVARMLSKDPGQRYQRPIEAAQALVPFCKPGGKPAAASGAPVPPGVASAGRGTLVAGDTSRVKGIGNRAANPPAQAPAAAAVEKESPFSQLGDAPALIPVQKKRKKGRDGAKPAPAAGWQRPAVLAGTAVALLALLLVGLWAGGVFKVKTKDGVLVVEVNEPNPDVYVDGEKVTVTWDDGGKKAEIRVKPGTRKVELKKDGVTMYGEEVEIEDGKRRILTAKLTRAEGDGYVALFNGKDLTGWLVENGDPEQWKVEEGILVARRQGTQPWSALLSNGDYSNFVLRFEYRPTEANSFSTVVYRSAVGETERVNGQNFPLHPNLGLGRKNQWGIESTGRLWWRFGRSLPANKKVDLKDSNEWNEVEVQIRNPELRMVVNGEEVSRTNLDEVAQIPDAHSGYKRPSGRIGFLALDSGAQFRNIRIKELPPGAAPVGLGGPRLAKRFPARFPNANGKWCVIGKHLVQPTLDPRVCILFGDREWTDYDFSVEAQRISGTDQFALKFRNRDYGRNMYLYALGWGNTTNTFEEWAGGKFSQLRREPQPGGALKTGEWYSARVEVRGNQVKCLFDGRQVFSFDAIRSPSGGVGLRTWGTAYVFRNIKVTSPDGKVLLEGLPELPGSGGK